MVCYYQIPHRLRRGSAQLARPHLAEELPMQVRSMSTLVLLGGSALALSLASPAAAVCDAYSGGCPSTPPGAGGGDVDLGGTDQNPATGGTDTAGSTGGTNTGGTAQNPGAGGTAQNPSTLPFTGGELVLLTGLGLGAVAGGTALVVAGRRKSSPAA
jgi:hypothetical protein